ncbi:hypothetical protein AVEN_91782-1 [Araneus ventricosus]|uniref:Uncharacterized protein n=1 Tax=Araneus ventricosus TaxID=182803 RepID=A0A4Y2IUA3_ARAVE|nr:hypothetical protein AVEN_91782-1 [Araneus ventricosus]
MRIKRDSEDKNVENCENKCEAMDTSKNIINENGKNNDEANVAVEHFSLSDELHGPESLPIYGESSYSFPAKCESKKKAKYKVKLQHENQKHIKKKKSHNLKNV